MLIVRYFSHSDYSFIEGVKESEENIEVVNCIEDEIIIWFRRLKTIRRRWILKRVERENFIRFFYYCWCQIIRLSLCVDPITYFFFRTLATQNLRKELLLVKSNAKASGFKFAFFEKSSHYLPKYIFTPNFFSFIHHSVFDIKRDKWVDRRHGLIVFEGQYYCR